MNNNFWTKITNFKILGKTIFSKEEICSEKNYEENEFKVYITQDYFNKEFDVKEKKDKDN
jgi:hypothetical protein